MKRNRVIAAVAVVLAAGVLLLAVCTVLPDEGPFNVLLITLDTTRADRLGCYGYRPALTPHLDQLGVSGTLFERAFCNVPLTLPSHATILTGLHPPEHGLRVNGSKRLDLNLPTLAGILGQNGYQTSAFIAAFALDSKFGLGSGFEVYHDDLTGAYKQQSEGKLSLYRPGALVADSALAWVDTQAHEPFFCWVHFYDPHVPYHPHKALAGTRFRGQKSYDAEVAYMDMQVGRLMTFLKQRQLLRRTLVIAVGDHGEGLGDHGESDHGYMLYESTLRVPLIISQPGHVPQAARVRTMVSLVDLLPTILDVLEIAQPDERSGRSFKAALFGQETDSPPFYAETDLPYVNFHWSPLRSMTTPRWKYVRAPRVELYDRQADPAELINLANDRPDKMAELEAKLAAMEQQMTPHSAERVRLSEDEIQRLESLGYLARAQDVDAQTLDIASLPDIKDMLPVVDMDRRMHALLHMEQTDQALELCQKMIRLSPDSGRVRCYLGDALAGAGRLEEAAQAYRQAMKVQADFEVAHNGLGVVLARMGRLDEAADWYAQALQLNPDYTQARNNLVSLLINAGRLDEAIDHLSEALRRDPDNAEAHNDMAGALITAGRLDQAVDHLSEALRLKPDYADAYFNLGRARVVQQDLDQGVIHYQQVLRLNPDRLDALNALAWLLATREGFSPPHSGQAVQLAERACELTGYREPAVLDTLAAAYAAAGRFSRAVTTAEKALELASAPAQSELAEAIGARLELYKAQRPYRQAP